MEGQDKQINGYTLATVKDTHFLEPIIDQREVKTINRYRLNFI